MKLHLAHTDGMYTFTAYGEDYVTVNERTYRQNLVVLPRQLITDWCDCGFDGLQAAHFARLAGLDIEILLLGTGATLRFPAPELLQPLMAARIGIEVMGTGAACRTFNILAAEGRKVGAAILAGPGA